MSLDVYLNIDSLRFVKGSGIFVRDGGSMKEITREEWDRLYPGRTPCIVVDEGERTTEVFRANVTHNVSPMAEAAGIYKQLWRPDEIGITHARQLIEPLRAGLEALKADPAKFEAMNPANGWGSYEGFVPWVESYLAACIEFPDAKVSVWR